MCGDVIGEDMVMGLFSDLFDARAIERGRGCLEIVRCDVW